MSLPSCTKGKRNVEKPYSTWTYDERIKLLQTRIRLDHLFTGKNSNASIGWRQVVEECHFGHDKTYLNGLMKKYKTFFKINTGDGAGDEAPEEKLNREDWPYFELIHEYAHKKDNYHPSYLLSNSRGVYRRPIEDEMETATEVLDSVGSMPSASSNDSKTTTKVLDSVGSMPSATSNDSTYPPDSSTSSIFFSSTPTTSRDSNLSNSSSYSGSRKKSKPVVNAQEKYLRKRDRRLDKKTNGLLGVFGQLVKIQHPSINVDVLLISSESSDSD